MIALAICFYLVGQNQLSYDNLSEEEIDGLTYGSFIEACWYMYTDFILGGLVLDSYEAGDASQAGLLYFLYIVASFMLLINLLNMLIAIMGNTYAVRGEVANEVKIKGHLEFVVDNWNFLEFAIPDTNKVKYIIAAFHAQSDFGGDQQILHEV